MAHELDTTNGITSFATARVHAWHRLGQVTPGLMSVDEALDAAHLRAWDVRLSPNQTTVLGEHGVTTLDTGGYSTVRTNPQTGMPEVLGRDVTDGYVPVQNEEQVEFLQALLDQSGAFIETAGAIKGGRQVFLSARLPEDMTIGGVDPLQLYVSVLNGHDGSMALRALASPVRIVCANTQAAALRSSQQRWSIRHTKGAASAVQQARQTLGLAWKFNEAFQAEAERMINEQLVDAEFDRLAAQLLGAPESKDSARTRTNKTRRLDTVRWLYREAPTQGAIRGTRWAGYQALAEYVDHYQPGSEDNRALAAVSGAGAKTKEQAFDLLRVPA